MSDIIIHQSHTKGHELNNTFLNEYVKSQGLKHAGLLTDNMFIILLILFKTLTCLLSFHCIYSIELSSEAGLKSLTEHNNYMVKWRRSVTGHLEERRPIWATADELQHRASAFC